MNVATTDMKQQQPYKKGRSISLCSRPGIDFEKDFVVGVAASKMMTKAGVASQQQSRTNDDKEHLSHRSALFAKWSPL